MSKINLKQAREAALQLEKIAIGEAMNCAMAPGEFDGHFAGEADQSREALAESFGLSLEGLWDALQAFEDDLPCEDCIRAEILGRPADKAPVCRHCGTFVGGQAA